MVLSFLVGRYTVPMVQVIEPVPLFLCESDR